MLSLLVELTGTRGRQIIIASKDNTNSERDEKRNKKQGMKEGKINSAVK